LASAAVVVLGVTVILEFQRREPPQTAMNWQEKARARASEPHEPFPLAPLPTSTVPEEERPVGAADHLVAAPDPEIEPSMEAAPPLEVLGPLESAVDPADGAGRGAEEALQAKGRAEESTTMGTTSSGERSTTAPPNRTSAKGSAPASPGTDARARSGWAAAGAQVSEGQVFVFMDAATAWRGFEPRAPCEAGRYAVRVRVQDGVIREVWPVANPPAPTRQVRASQLVLGLEIEDVPDGEYSAEVVVEPRNRMDGDAAPH
jgi:hypothetical protein